MKNEGCFCRVDFSPHDVTVAGGLKSTLLDAWLIHTGDRTMPWKTPDFEEINLSGEVTAYANTDDEVRASEQRVARIEPAPAAGDKPQQASA